jgi:GH24 family phage-related lysozyme (muramidase)
VNDDLTTSDRGLTLLTECEGFRSHCYDDAAGYCTIGFGHLVHRGCTGTDPSREAPFADGVSETRALELLRGDVAIAESVVKRCVKQPLRQGAFDALVSFVYNVGEGAFTGSTLLRCLNQGHWAMVPAQFHRWTHAGGKVLAGLVKRRRLEANMFAGTR